MEKLADWCEAICDDEDDGEIRIDDILKKFYHEKAIEEDEKDEADDEMPSDLSLGANAGVADLRDIFRNFKNNISSTKSKEFINFAQLADFLTRMQRIFNSSPQREFPNKAFTAGRPNLVICPEKEIHKRVLSIYSEDAKKPLPALDEVLMCTKATTAEQVELICMRAFNCQRGKIYTIVHAHLLSFEVASYLDELIEQMRPKNDNYKLVFVCSREQAENSYITW